MILHRDRLLLKILKEKMRDNIKNKGIEKLRVLISGGGTGGHVFPAIAIAQEIQKRIPNAEFLWKKYLKQDLGLKG